MNRIFGPVDKRGRALGRYIRRQAESDGAIFSAGFRFVAAWGLSFVLFSVLISLIDLSDSARTTLAVLLAVVVGGIVTLKPRFALSVVCAVLGLIGFGFIVISLYIESTTGLGFDPGLLGAGTSIMAIAIAVYALLVQTQRVKGKEGYMWVDGIKKFRCAYCRDLGRDCCYKTFSGVKRHIANEHPKTKD